MTEFLGQDLYRDALEAGSLESFNAANERLLSSDVAMDDKVNTWKAMRFGLAAFAIAGWEESVVEKSTVPFQIGDRILTHRFKDSPFFKPHDSTMPEADYMQKNYYVAGSVERRGVFMQGAYALESLRLDLQASASTYLGRSDLVYESGISDKQVQSAFQRYGKTALEYGVVDAWVDRYWWGEEESTDDVYYIKRNKKVEDGILSDRLVYLSASLIKFTSIPVEEVMARLASEMKEAANQQAVDTHSGKAFEYVQEIFDHAFRSSQALGGADRVINDEDKPAWAYLLSETRFQTKLNGRDELYWPQKHQRPYKAGKDQAETNPHNFEFSTKPNRCPISYTRRAGEELPGKRLISAIQTYLGENGLFNPAFFVSPAQSVMAD